MDILYLCDGKVPKCSGTERCYIRSNKLYTAGSRDCYYTDDITHAINFRPMSGACGIDSVIYVELDRDERIALAEQLQTKT